MAKVAQTIIKTGEGRAKRLMVKAKGRSPRAFHTYVENVYDYAISMWVEKNRKSRIEGCYRGLKQVPKENAFKHPDTGDLQTGEVLVQMGVNLCSLPPSMADFYWEEGTVSSSGKFKPLPQTAPVLATPSTGQTA